MEHKPIDLDGVNVSDCAFYIQNSKYSCDLSFYTKEELCNCDEIDDCYFKQLALKTQEYEELKAYAQRQENQREEYYKEYLKLSQECEELKKQLQGDKGLITSAGKMNYQLLQEYDKLKAENEELKKKCNIYTCGICGNKEDCNKLYKTLTEIKEIAKNRSNYTCSKCIKTEILQKISEVIK